MHWQTVKNTPFRINVVVVYHVTIVAIGNGLLKKCWPLRYQAAFYAQQGVPLNCFISGLLIFFHYFFQIRPHASLLAMMNPIPVPGFGVVYVRLYVPGLAGEVALDEAFLVLWGRRYRSRYPPTL